MFRLVLWFMYVDVLFCEFYLTVGVYCVVLAWFARFACWWVFVSFAVGCCVVI